MLLKADPVSVLDMAGSAQNPAVLSVILDDERTHLTALRRIGDPRGDPRVGSPAGVQAPDIRRRGGYNCRA
jgi:hypothetical protein